MCMTYQYLCPYPKYISIIPYGKISLIKVMRNEDPATNLVLGRFWFSLRFGSDFGGLVGLRVALALRFGFDGKP